jgi:Xaa-Pro aminopeptidase
VARTAVMGEPGRRASRAADAILTGLEAAIGRIAPGVTAGDIHATAVSATREAGLPGFTRYHVGHGIGLEPYERPKLNAGNSTPLEAGDVLRVETPYYEHGWSGVSIKDTVLVTTTGARALNRSARGLVVLD